MAVRAGGKVLVAMSGGVDSTVSAYLLKRQGWALEGVFMKNWDERDELGVCHADKEYQEVQRICGMLGVPCRQVDFVKEYWNDVFSSFLADYERGLTPNPDVLCNHKIKFGSLYAEAKRSGASHLATGHYAQLQHDPQRGETLLAAAVDANKDQTYFLAGLPAAVLQACVFPVGGRLKPDVKRVAREAGLDAVAGKKESMGICFIGKRRLGLFLEQYLAGTPGPIVDLTGRMLGMHRGVQFFTLGQGLGLHSQPARLFVVGKDVASKTLYVDARFSSPVLLARQFVVGRLHWTSPLTTAQLRSAGGGMHCGVRVRHRLPLAPAVVQPSHGTVSSSETPLPVFGWTPSSAAHAAVWDSLCSSSDALVVRCAEPIRAVTPGQTAAFYHHGICLGGGTILATRTLAQEDSW